MSEQELVRIGTDQLDQIWSQLESDLQALKRSGIPEKIDKAVDITLAQLASDRTGADLVSAYKNALNISHTLGFLSVAANQRSRSTHYQNQGWFATLLRQLFPGAFQLEPTQADRTAQLNQIEQLIQSCYRPFLQFLVSPANLFL